MLGSLKSLPEEVFAVIREEYHQRAIGSTRRLDLPPRQFLMCQIGVLSWGAVDSQLCCCRAAADAGESGGRRRLQPSDGVEEPRAGSGVVDGGERVEVALIGTLRNPRAPMQEA
jgi:hypothetical protein